MDSLLAALSTAYPDLVFAPGRTFYWSPKQHKIHYAQRATGPAASYALLHEVGHALLNHKNYTTDFELLTMEVAAWEEAKRIAAGFTIQIDENHVQDCLDSYRDWLFQRSVCPTCSTKSLQQDGVPLYRCHNCHATWRVATSRFCRPYRQGRPSEALTVHVV